MRQSFAKTRRDERLVIKEVIHAMQNFVSEDEGVSIIVFKPTFAKAVDQVVSGGVSGWLRDGRGLLRTNLLFAKAS
jgi:uncharacterized protein YfaQ (DUF2300 family)